MVVCKFWQRGSCRNGDNCNFEHPPRQGTQYQGYQNQGQQGRNGSTSSPFGQQTADNSRNNGNDGFQRGGLATSSLPFALDKRSIITDLKYERPQWILSAYGPGNKTTPAQLFGGPLREQSFEEMRLLHYMAIAARNPQQAINEVNALWQQSEQQILATINNVDGAINYIINGEKEHPNRNEICEMSVGIEGGYKPNPLRQGGTGTPFGAPSQPVNTSTFGQPSQPSSGAFGQPSQPSTGAFGQAAQAAPSDFGQPSQLTGLFGQPSSMSQKPSAFGAPSFGAPSQPAGAFRQPTQSTASPFGQPSQQSTGAFGQPSALGQSTSAFSTPAFGAPSQPAAGAFGQPSGLGQKPNPWGRPATSNPPPPSTSNPFGQPSQAVTTGFPASQPIPFGQPSQSSAFGQPSESNPFNNSSQPLATGFPPPQPSPFGLASQPSTFGQPSQSATSLPTPLASGNAPSNTFGAPSTAPSNNAFGGTPQPAPVNNVFASSSQPSQTSLFGQPSNINAASSLSLTNTGAGVSSNTDASSRDPVIGSTSHVNGNIASKHYPPTEFPNPRPLTAYSNVTPDGLITMFKGKPVRYRGEAREPWIIENGTWSKKIWCPKGFSAVGNTESEADASKYTAELEAAYSHLRLDGEFPNGVMPMIPPKKEWCSYEF